MALAAGIKTTHVVRDASGQVVVAFWGAPELTEQEASFWADRPGYTVEPTALDEAD